MSLKSASSGWVGAFFYLALLSCHVFAQTEKNIQFGGTYANLKPAQRQLTDEWVRQFNELAKQNLKPAEVYDDLPLSTRTTFEAVTHGLMTSNLTDPNGRSLGTALDVVSYLETVRGKIPEVERRSPVPHLCGAEADCLANSERFPSSNA
jgi:hypothetical protein